MAFRNPLLDAAANPFQQLADDAPAMADLPLWQRDEALEGLTRGTRPTTSKLTALLNGANSLKNDLLMGRPLFSGSETGETMDAYGIRPSEDALGGWGRPIAEFAFDAGTDPLNLVSFGSGAASKATLAARAAGIADDVTRVAGRNLADDLARGTRQIDHLGDFGHARNAADSLYDNFGKTVDNLTDDDLLSRPLVGKRAAGRNTTLRELVDAQADSGAARESIEQWLQKNHRMGYDEVADDRLYNDVGLWLPKILGGPIGTQLPNWAGGRGAAALFDRGGQAIRWSWPGRHAVAASNMFGDNVLGATDEGDQILNKSLVRSDRVAAEAASRWTTRMARELAERSPAAFGDPQVSNAVRNVIEGTASSADRALVTSNNLDDFVTQWQNTSSDYLARSREAGIGSGVLNDPYGTKYFPRGVDEGVLGRNAPVAPSKGRDWSVMTGDQLARDEAYLVPGGTQAINELSRDAGVLNAASDGQAAQHIYNSLNARRTAGQPEYTLARATKLARDIRAMSPQAREAQRGLFDKHFLEDASRYVRGRERAIGRSRVMYDALGSSATLDNYLNVPGGRHDSMLRTLSDLDLRTTTDASGMVQGAQQQILNRINARLAGTGAQQLTLADLANVSVDQRLVDRFNRVADFYAMPEVQGVMGKFMDDLTNLWKSSVLSFPARFARDWFSGAISNVIEVGNVNDLRNGYAASKYLLQGQMDRLGPVVAKMPRYEGVARTQGIDAAIAAFRDDLGASGVLGGRRIEDVGARWTGSQTGESIRDAVLPGASPVTTVGYQVGDALTGRTPLSPNNAAYSEFYRGGIRGYTDPLRRFAGAINPLGGEPIADYLADRQLTDPILRWGAKLGDTTDSINRLGGYAALLLQGISPTEAARRMAAAQVDYSNLTRFEKGFIKSFVPFWSYNSRIGAYVAQKIWNRPGGAYTNVALRAPDAMTKTDPENPEEGYVPKQIKENIGFSLEGLRDIPVIGNVLDTLAPKTDGVNSFLNSIDVPGSGLINMFNVKQGLDGGIKVGDSAYNTFLDTTSQLMHPIIRDGVELLSGRNLHTGKSLAEFEPTIQKIGRAAGVDPFSTPDYLLKGSNMLLDFVPHAPRALQLANRLMDSERVPSLTARLGQSAVNSLTGVKVTPIKDDAARMDASRELGDMLSDSPAIKKFESTYIPEELLPYADPEDVLLYRLNRQMRKEARAAKKSQAGDLGNPFML